MNNYKTVGSGGFGKCRVYRDEALKRMVVEKRVGNNFLSLMNANRIRFTSIINQYSEKNKMLQKESFMMWITKIFKLDCCVEILNIKSNPFRIIMEYCEGGDLRKILDQYKVHDSDKIIIISQILIAIEKIHNLGLIHGDLKCANIFLVNKYIPGNFREIKIKIGDFGLSEIEGNRIHGGTPGFYAPEITTVGGSYESDIYSIGKVMLEIMTQLPVSLIAKINIASLYILKKDLPKFLNISEFYNIVIPCLSIDPKKRPNASKLKKQFHGLMDKWYIGTQMNSQMLSQYNIGEKVHVDSHIHPLILSDDKMRGYGGYGWYCSICNNKDKAYLKNTLSYHCHKCEYDLCQKCIEVHNYTYANNNIKKAIYKEGLIYVKAHEHPLILSGKFERNYPDYGIWVCDLCKTRFSLYISSFHCKKCEFDVCYNCFKKYGEIREKPCCCTIF